MCLTKEYIAEHAHQETSLVRFPLTVKWNQTNVTSAGALLMNVTEHQIQDDVFIDDIQFVKFNNETDVDIMLVIDVSEVLDNLKAGNVYAD